MAMQRKSEAQRDDHAEYDPRYTVTTATLMRRFPGYEPERFVSETRHDILAIIVPDRKLIAVNYSADCDASIMMIAGIDMPLGFMVDFI